jgi:putative salt-induced outer membrane protein YdiY
VLDTIARFTGSVFLHLFFSKELQTTQKMKNLLFLSSITKTIRLSFSLSAATLALCVIALSATTAFADTITTKDGSVIKGKILSSSEGVIQIETDFAGIVSISQDQVVHFTSDQPIFVQLEDGNTLLGTVTPAEDGLNIDASNGDFQTETSAVISIWQKGDESPIEKKQREALAALDRKWAYEAAVDISGSDGNTDRSNFGIAFKATRTGLDDTLKFYTSIDKAKDSGVTTADEIKGGIDYSHLISEHNSWYARVELETDKIETIDLRTTAAFGLGRNLIKTEVQTLEVRGGLAYRHEAYDSGANVDSPGLDFGLNHTYVLTDWGNLVNSLTYNPSFDDFGNYRVTHESSFEMPISAGEMWKMRIGLAHDYSSMPAFGREKLDTTYFIRLILDWE